MSSPQAQKSCSSAQAHLMCLLRGSHLRRLHSRSGLGDPGAPWSRVPGSSAFAGGRSSSYAEMAFFVAGFVLPNFYNCKKLTTLCPAHRASSMEGHPCQGDPNRTAPTASVHVVGPTASAIRRAPAVGNGHHWTSATRASPLLPSCCCSPTSASTPTSYSCAAVAGATIATLHEIVDEPRMMVDQCTDERVKRQFEGPTATSSSSSAPPQQWVLKQRRSSDEDIQPRPLFPDVQSSWTRTRRPTRAPTKRRSPRRKRRAGTSRARCMNSRTRRPWPSAWRSRSE